MIRLPWERNLSNYPYATLVIQNRSGSTRSSTLS